MNTPNKLTLLRIILVLPFIALLSATIYLYFNHKEYKWLMIASGSIFIVAMITDFIDGFLARKNNQVTTFGKLFDPLADKFITTTALVSFSIMGIVPFYVTLLFILRDILVDGSRNLAAKNNVDVSAGIIGKAKTMLMSIGIPIIFFIVPFINTKLDPINPSWEIWLLISPLLIANVLSLYSGYKYLNAVKQFINTK